MNKVIIKIKSKKRSINPTFINTVYFDGSAGNHKHTNLLQTQYPIRPTFTIMKLKLLDCTQGLKCQC